MSLHSSLKIDTASSQQRNVLTRIERIKDLMRKGLWSDASAITALPKTKMVRIKAKKKVKSAEEAAAAAGTAAPAGGAAATAKPAAAPAKPAAGAKAAEKK